MLHSLRWPCVFVLASALFGGAGCAAPPEAAVTGDDAALTQSRTSKLSDASTEAVRQGFESAAKGSDFYGYAAAFTWGTEVALGAKLNDAQLTFLAEKLIQGVTGAEDTIPGYLLNAVDVADPSSLATDELRLTGAGAEDLTKALVSAGKAGHRIVRYAPKVTLPGAVRSAGAIMVVDMKNHEALVVYGRRGPAPLHVDCTVTEMHSYEFEESLSKEEYPSVEVTEVPIVGDVSFDVGVGGYSNATAAENEEDYRVVVTRTGAKVEVEAKGATTGFLAKLVAEGTTGTVYGDRDGNGRANKAATLSCKGL